MVDKDDTIDVENLGVRDKIKIVVKPNITLPKTSVIKKYSSILCFISVIASILYGIYTITMHSKSQKFRPNNVSTIRIDLMTLKVIV